mgnify:CR=1 FL=1
MTDFLDTINAIKIPDIWQISLSFIVSVFIVYLIEWLKQPSVEIMPIADLILNDGRKFLKVKVKIGKRGWYRKIFPWQNAASFARLKGYLISCCGKDEVVLFSYTVKWDTRPEPWDYIQNKPRLELLPAVSEPENFLVGDECSASVAVKHLKEPHFYIYDGNYYVNQNTNHRNEKQIKLRLIFSSSSISTEKDFFIVNGNSTTEAFNLIEEEKQ